MGDFVNEFSYSHSRRELFEQCKRAYFHNYYLSWGGWRRDASGIQREAYRLKKLDDRWTWAGGIAHDTITRSLLETKAGLDVSADQKVGAAHEVFRREWLASRNGRRDAKNGRGFWGLLEHEYSEPVEQARWAMVWERTRAGLMWWFKESGWLERTRTLPKDRWLAVDDGDLEKTSVVVDGVKLWTMPDLAFIDDNGAAWVVDWKTGKPKQLHLDQMAGYATGLAARNGGVLPGSGPLRVSLVYLTQGKTGESVVGPAEMESFRGRMAASVAAMRAVLKDPAKNEPLPMEHFPMTDDLDECRRCAFRRICKRG
jgi:hypothetical protein